MSIDKKNTKLKRDLKETAKLPRRQNMTEAIGQKAPPPPKKTNKKNAESLYSETNVQKLKLFIYHDATFRQLDGLQSYL